MIHATARAVAITGLSIPATRVALVIGPLRLHRDPLEAPVTAGLSTDWILDGPNTAARLHHTEIPVGGTGHFLDM